jgi:hypothetical protein
MKALVPYEERLPATREHPGFPAIQLGIGCGVLASSLLVTATKLSVAPTDAPEAPNSYDATLALRACVPDGEKIEREALLHDAARELGYPQLTRKVRRALNKALNVENNAGRLRTDWERVWRPRKK